jgi:hypothetical protein
LSFPIAAALDVIVICIPLFFCPIGVNRPWQDGWMTGCMDRWMTGQMDGKLHNILYYM